MQKSPNAGIATTLGVFYLLIGMFGVSATDNAGLFTPTGGLLFGVFEVNIATNALHVIIGLGLIIAGASGAGAAKVANRPVGAIFVVLAVLGYALKGTDYNVLALNLPDAILYTVTALLLLATALGADKPAPKVAAQS